MICLSDNDLIRKLAACDLLEEALAALEATRDEVFVLPTARYVLLKPIKKPEQAKVRMGEAVFERLKAFLESVQTLSAPPPAAEQQLLDDAVGIDAGEAVLFSSTAHFAEFLVATSDKTSLRALASTPACQPVFQRLQGHVITFEQILVRVIDRIGFESLLAKVVPALHCDTVLRAVFGSGLEATEANVRSGLIGYIEHLRRETNGLLITP